VKSGLRPAPLIFVSYWDDELLVDPSRQISVERRTNEIFSNQEKNFKGDMDEKQSQ
jgi:hypothetical protein